jgi:hypothetical protein
MSLLLLPWYGPLSYTTASPTDQNQLGAGQHTVISYTALSLPNGSLCYTVVTLTADSNVLPAACHQATSASSAAALAFLELAITLPGCHIKCTTIMSPYHCCCCCCCCRLLSPVAECVLHMQAGQNCKQAGQKCRQANRRGCKQAEGQADGQAGRRAGSHKAACNTHAGAGQAGSQASKQATTKPTKPWCQPRHNKQSKLQHITQASTLTLFKTKTRFSARSNACNPGLRHGQSAPQGIQPEAGHRSDWGVRHHCPVGFDITNKQDSSLRKG